MKNPPLTKFQKNMRPYDLYPLLFLNLKEYILKHFAKSAPCQFPKRVGSYRFDSPIKKFGPRQSYMLALYKNGEGKKAVAKMRSAKIKGYHYYSLLNEIHIYELLNSAVERTMDRMPKQFRQMHIPQLIKKVETKDCLIALIEFIEGETAENLKPDQKIKLYLKTVDFIDFLGNQLTDAEKKQISQRTAINYILLYPLLLTKAMFTYPRAIPYLFRGAIFFIKSFPIVSKNLRYTLVHRDLHFQNIIIKDDRISLIDLQHCVFTEALHEFITTLRYRWKEDRFYTLCLSEIKNRYSKRKEFENLFKAYTINSVTHGLTGRNFPAQTVDSWIDFLKFGLTFKMNRLVP